MPMWAKSGLSGGFDGCDGVSLKGEWGATKATLTTKQSFLRQRGGGIWEEENKTSPNDVPPFSNLATDNKGLTSNLQAAAKQYLPLYETDVETSSLLLISNSMHT